MQEASLVHDLSKMADVGAVKYRSWWNWAAVGSIQQGKNSVNKPSYRWRGRPSLAAVGCPGRRPAIVPIVYCSRLLCS